MKWFYRGKHHMKKGRPTALQLINRELCLEHRELFEDA
jgi:hypothetical protein